MSKLSGRLLISVLIFAVVWAPIACTGGESIKVATTTSLYDSGLWQVLEPAFKARYGVDLQVVYAGTGKALAWARNGDVDVVVVHDRASEDRFIADGYGMERVPFAYNYFIIVGPENDPAGIRDMSPDDAFARLYLESSARFISRGDGSGTHAREKQIWSQAGYDYEQVRKSGSWYVEGGSGMGPTLKMASEMQGYTLTDIGTFLTYRGELGLVPLVSKDELLKNVYSVIVAAMSKIPDTAGLLVEFLSSPEAQELMRDFGVDRFGESIFYPCAGQEL